MGVGEETYGEYLLREMRSRNLIPDRRTLLADRKLSRVESLPSVKAQESPAPARAKPWPLPEAVL